MIKKIIYIYSLFFKLELPLSVIISIFFTAI